LRQSFDRLEPPEALPFARATWWAERCVFQFRAAPSTVVLAKGGTSRWVRVRQSFDRLEPPEALPFARATWWAGRRVFQFRAAPSTVVLANGGTSRWMRLRQSFNRLEPPEALPFARATDIGTTLAANPLMPLLPRKPTFMALPWIGF